MGEVLKLVVCKSALEGAGLPVPDGYSPMGVDISKLPDQSQKNALRQLKTDGNDHEILGDYLGDPTIALEVKT